MNSLQQSLEVGLTRWDCQWMQFCITAMLNQQQHSTVYILKLYLTTITIKFSKISNSLLRIFKTWINLFFRDKGIKSLPQTRISLQPDGIKFWYFKAEIILSNRVHSLKYPRSTRVGCKDIGKRKSEFVAKTQFLFDFFQHFQRRRIKLNF